MGCMRNTSGMGSGRIRDVSVETENEDRFMDGTITLSINRGFEIFSLWGKRKYPSPMSHNWKKFIKEVKTTILKGVI